MDRSAIAIAITNHYQRQPDALDQWIATTNARMGLRRALADFWSLE